MSATLPLLIIDDEKPARDNLRFLLGKLGLNLSLEIVEASSAQEAREILNKQAIELIFLDIQMPGEEGFDFLLSIPHSKYAIIFTTAYHQFAIKAFRAGAIDYLLKPIDFIELQEAVLKANINQSISALHVPQKIENSVLKDIQLQAKSGHINKLRIANKNGYILLSLADISYLEADSNYTIFHLINLKKIVSAKSLKEYEELIEGQAFFRIHKSYLINLHQFKCISKTDLSIAVMNDGSNLPIARRKFSSFEDTAKAMQHGNLYQ